MIKDTKMTKEKILEKYKISSKFDKVVKSDIQVSKYANEHHYLVPKFTINIGIEEFEYTQSVHYLNKLVKPVSPVIADLCLYKDSPKLWCISKNKIKLVSDRDHFTLISGIPYLNTKFKNRVLSDDDLLFAFRAIVEDSLYFINYTTDEFLEEFGYVDSIKQVRKGESIYKECEKSYRKLQLQPNELTETLDNLSELGIE